MATLSDLVAKLTLQAQVEEEVEARDVFTPEELGKLILSAIAEHNPSMTLGTMTQAEEKPVLLLAEIEMCYIRAATEAGKDYTKGGGASISTVVGNGIMPFDKWMKLAAALYQRYNVIVARLGGDSGVSTVVVVSNVYKQSDLLNGLSFYDKNLPVAAPATLTTRCDVDGEVILNWSTTPSDLFRKFLVFWSLSPGIYRPENPKGTMSVKYISASAQLALSTYDQDELGCIVDNLPADTLVYFLVVTETTTRRFSYSNEMVQSTTASIPMQLKRKKIKKPKFRFKFAK